jgi:hypothetical protein
LWRKEGAIVVLKSYLSDALDDSSPVATREALLGQPMQKRKRFRNCGPLCLIERGKKGQLGSIKLRTKW